MALISKKKLILIECKKIEFADKENPGKMLQKYKHTFLQSDGNLLIGYLSTNDYEGEVQDVEGWDDIKAKIYPFAPRIFQGITTYILQGKPKP